MKRVFLWPRRLGYVDFSWRDFHAFACIAFYGITWHLRGVSVQVGWWADVDYRLWEKWRAQ